MTVAVFAGLSLLGRGPKGEAFLRSGARPGDVLFVTGEGLGGSRSGRHLDFVPRLAEAARLRAWGGVTAMRVGCFLTNV